MPSAGATRGRVKQVPQLAPGWERRALALSPAEGFLLSRIDGTTPWTLLREIGGLAPDEADRCLERWVVDGLVTVDGSEAEAIRSRAGAAPGPPAGGELEAGVDPDLDIPVEAQRRVLLFEAGLERPVPRAARCRRGGRFEGDQARLFPALEGVPPGPLLPARDRTLRREARPDLQEDRRGLRAADGPDHAGRARALDGGPRGRAGAGPAGAGRGEHRRRCRRAAVAERSAAAFGGTAGPRAPASPVPDSGRDPRRAPRAGARVPRRGAGRRSQAALDGGSRERAARDRLRSLERRVQEALRGAAGEGERDPLGGADQASRSRSPRTSRRRRCACSRKRCTCAPTTRS